MCEFNDCGWCYHENGPSNGCPGIEKCPIDKINMNKNEQLKHMKSIRKPMPKPICVIKNQKKNKLEKINKREIY